jgi:hypothetical protein
MTPRRRTDNRLDDAPMTPVVCRQCSAQVLARKSSWNQTSVQWTGTALRRCEERRDVDHFGELAGKGLFLACSALNTSILDAARTGTLSVVDDNI